MKTLKRSFTIEELYEMTKLNKNILNICIDCFRSADSDSSTNKLQYIYRN